MPTDLETLLRETKVEYGRIALYRSQDGQWHASVCHFSHHMTNDCKGYDDPVEALRVALLEDDRVTADKVRRYKASPKLGDSWKEKGGFPVFSAAPAADDEFGALM